MNKYSALILSFSIVIFIQACTSHSTKTQTQTQTQFMSKDALIIQQLEKAGKNLSNATNIEFFLYFPKQSDAQQAATSLKAEGFIIDLSRDDFKKMWLVLATKEIIPNEINLHPLRLKFESMTQGVDGKYLDWSTPMAE